MHAHTSVNQLELAEAWSNSNPTHQSSLY